MFGGNAQHSDLDENPETVFNILVFSTTALKGRLYARVDIQTFKNT